MILITMVLWFVSAIVSTNQHEPVLCYQSAKWDGHEWIMGDWACIGGDD